MVNQVIFNLHNKVEGSSKNMHSDYSNYHVIESDLFDKSQRIRLPRYNPETISNIWNNSLSVTHSTFKQLTDTFFYVIMSDRDTLIKFISDISRESSIELVPIDVKTKLVNFTGAGDDLLSMIISGFNKGILSHKYLNRIIKRYIFDRDKLTSIKQLSIDSSNAIELCDDPTVISLIPTDNYSTKDVAPLHEHILNLKTHIENIGLALSKGDNPIVKLDLLTSEINALITNCKIPVEQIKTIEKEMSFPAVVTTAKHYIKTKPMKLKNKRQIILTTNQYNLDEFSRMELEEILQFLDITVENTVFDELKSDIIHKLSDFNV